MKKPPSRLTAIVLGFAVAFIWSTSWVLIKIGLKDIPSLTFAGLRYFVGFLCLVPFLLDPKVRAQIKGFSRAVWVLVILMGVVTYFIAQGAQFISLDYLPATTLSLILNLTSLFVTFTAIFMIKESPTWVQWLGLAINLMGVIIFFYPDGFQGSSPIGFIFALLCLAANVFGTLIGRKVNKAGRVNPLPVTLVSMGIGSVLMLVTGISFQGLPPLSTESIVIILILGVVNTAFTFTIWNYTLQVLSAMESSIINGTMMVWIAILAWLFLGERQGLAGIIGLVLSFVGAVIVNLRNEKKPA